LSGKLNLALRRVTKKKDIYKKESESGETPYQPSNSLLEYQKSEREETE